MKSVELGTSHPDTDGRWFDLAVAEFPDERLKAAESRLLLVPVRESNGDPVSLAAMKGHYLAGVEFALEMGFTHVTFFEQVIPAKGKPISMHDEMFRIANYSGYEGEIFVTKPDRASRHLGYGARFWENAKAVGYQINTKEKSYPLTRAGRKQWLIDVEVAFKNNERRSLRNKESHRQSLSRGQYRWKPPRGFTQIGGKLVALPSWQPIYEDIARTAMLGGDTKELLRRLDCHAVWKQAHGSKGTEKRLEEVRNVLLNPYLAGLRQPEGFPEGFYVQVNGTEIVKPELHGEFVLKFGKQVQSKLEKDPEFYLAGRVKYGTRRQKVELAKSLVVVDDEVLYERWCYVFEMDGKEDYQPIETLHNQLPDIWRAIAGKKPYLPADLAERWEATPDEERKAFVKKYVTQTLGYSNGQLTPPKWA